MEVWDHTVIHISLLGFPIEVRLRPVLGLGLRLRLLRLELKTVLKP